MSVVMRHSVHAFLRDCLKVTNWALLLMGLGFALTSGYFLLQFTRASHDALADASAPPPSPPPSVPGLPATNTSRIDRVLNTQPWCVPTPSRVSSLECLVTFFLKKNLSLRFLSFRIF